MKRVTFDMLAEMGACTEQAALFVETFGSYNAWKGVEVDRERLLVAQYAGLNLKWLIHALDLCRDEDSIRTCDSMELVLHRLLEWSDASETEETPIEA